MPPSPTELAVDRSASGVAFWIHVSPRSRQSGAGGLHGDALRLSVRAAPVKGEANAECIRVLAKTLGVPAASVWLAPGAKGRRKRVSVRGEPGPLEASLLALAGTGRVG